MKVDLALFQRVLVILALKDGVNVRQAGAVPNNCRIESVLVTQDR